MFCYRARCSFLTMTSVVLDVDEILICGSSFGVLVVAADPERPTAILVAAFRDNIQVVIVDIEQLVPTHVAGISVENVTALVLVENAVPFPVWRPWVLQGVFEDRFSRRHFFRPERYVMVETK